MRWALRRAADADAAALSLVASASFLETFAGVLDGADIIAHCAAKSSADVFRGWIADPKSVVALAEAEIGAAPLGYTVSTAPDLPIPGEAGDIELRRIYALAPTHGLGLGRALMARAIDDARAMGMRRMLLGVYGGNARAQHFYQRQGFTVVGERRFLVGSSWHDDLIYARGL